MTTPEKFNAVVNAMKFQTWDNGKEGYIISEELKTGEVHDELLNLVYGENVGGQTDLSYEIVAKATGLIEEIGLKNLQDDDAIFNNEDQWASVYTYDRLNYLNANNESEIHEVQREYECGISDACAIWYDKQVRDTADTLRNFIITTPNN